MSKETCLCCIPIEPGVKVLAGFSILGTIMVGTTFWLDKDFFNLFGHIIVLYFLMSLVWILTFTSGLSRKFVFTSFMILIWLGVATFETYIFASGQMGDYLCSQENVDTMNE